MVFHSEACYHTSHSPTHLPSGGYILRGGSEAGGQVSIPYVPSFPFTVSISCWDLTFSSFLFAFLSFNGISVTLWARQTCLMTTTQGRFG